jgi:two-component system sensor histidine kinase ChvG
VKNLFRFLSRISIRLLAFNLLLVFLPALAILSLKTYERQLLDLQERSMVQQGRVLAAALGARGAVPPEEVKRILVNMQQEVDARLRVFDPDFVLLGDSSLLGPRRETARLLPEVTPPPVRDQLIYRFGSALYQGLARLRPPEPPGPDVELDPKRKQIYHLAIQDALEGRYIPRTVKPSEGRSLTMYIAIPVRSGTDIVGAVLVSKSTYQILKVLWDFRLSTFKVVLAAAAAAAVLSLLVSTTIARPLSHLRSQARAMVDRRGRLQGRFKASRSLDEIGDLSRALAGLTDQLEGHLQFMESFASDVSHEFKNPLAAIRTATELLAELEEPAERRRFIDMIFRDIARLEHLLTGVREISRIDTHLDDQQTLSVDLCGLLGGLVERYEMAPAALTYTLQVPSQAVNIQANPERLAQIFENLLDNASSFAPQKSEVTVELTIDEDKARITVSDQGPGIPEEHLERIFGRFFSYRPTEQTRSADHTGLGLAIVRAIVEGYGGLVQARNTKSGAAFQVELPVSTS